ncbi:MAG TPA: hypothetical protein VGJ59_09990 [Jatrophihabitantaceae bacterium]|jgi:hypothetical protein
MTEQPRDAGVVRGKLADVTTQLAGIAPLARRVAGLDPRGLLRIRLDGRVAAAYALLPFGVLVGRTVRVDPGGVSIQCVVRARELISWLDGEVDEPPRRRDMKWRGALPPALGWRRVETVPDEVVRDVVRKGAATFRQAAAREGAPGAQPRAEVADALLDSVVLSATEGDLHAEITLRAMSALTRMGFLPRGSYVAIDVSGRWSRLAAEYGSVYTERPGMALGIVS